MEKLSSIEKDLLLMALAHHMGQDLRWKIMKMLPEAYNRWMGQPIMVVERACDSEEKPAKAIEP
jgi:hypothetical protein